MIPIIRTKRQNVVIPPPLSGGLWLDIRPVIYYPLKLGCSAPLGCSIDGRKKLDVQGDTLMYFIVAEQFLLYHRPLFIFL